ncbi:uroporphyrinogen-III synthase [Ereboglobus sp. PH5-5]|uniref:uroporphyrinogen-III synthase n=1 Tax=Ereboglobus sp. PH5-5 TaxID=2940529 RepID=UPI0024052110|nr:uroporphyrinogen-III synthase [Ereboglobus sp. PH5-5]MDF9832084.1 uroporphyrinogen-III synthase [Ereboglobus sp. PH5-5]
MSKASTTNQPFLKRRIVITRTQAQNAGLREKLESLGAEVLDIPLITVTPAIDKNALVEIFAELGSYDWIVFTSANGARIFFEQFFKGFDDIRSLGLLRFACVGRATAREIEKHHIKVECIPKTATGEALADALIDTGSLDSAKVIVVTGNLNRDTLVQKLGDARAIVDRLPLYKTEKTNLADNPAAADYREHGADALLFTSSSTVDSFVAQGASLRRGEKAKQPLYGSIGPHTSETMRENKIPVDFEAGEATLDAFIDALIAKL